MSRFDKWVARLVESHNPYDVRSLLSSDSVHASFLMFQLFPKANLRRELHNLVLAHLAAALES